MGRYLWKKYLCCIFFWKISRPQNTMCYPKHHAASPEFWLIGFWIHSDIQVSFCTTICSKNKNKIVQKKITLLNKCLHYFINAKKNLIFVSFLDKVTLNYIFQSTVLHTPKIQQLRYKRKACVTITTNATLNAVLVQKK